MKAIFKKELRGYFLSPIGYIFIGVFMAFAALFFTLGIIGSGETDISLIFSNINIICLFLVSVLTMRSLAEEKNKKTDQLLLTSPVSITEIVMGKYLAAMAVFGITMLTSLVFPIILFVFASPSFAEILGSYIGFALLWGAFIAIGIFISSLTENQIISAFSTFGVLLLIYFMDGIASGIGNKTIVSIIQWFSLLSRFNEFMSGILNLTNVIYYLSFTAVFLLLTIHAVDRRRWN